MTDHPNRSAGSEGVAPSNQEELANLIYGVQNWTDAVWLAGQLWPRVNSAPAKTPAAASDDRKTITIPPGYEDVRDAEGRATGEVRKIPTDAQGAALRAAAERVCWFDWSDNDMDAVAAIDALRKVITSQPSPAATVEERQVSCAPGGQPYAKAPQRSSAATGGAEEAIRDWWYSRDRQPATTSKEAAKSLIWYLAKCGLKIVREPQPGDWINEPLRNWTASTDVPQTSGVTLDELSEFIDTCWANDDCTGLARHILGTYSVSRPQSGSSK